MTTFRHSIAAALILAAAAIPGGATPAPASAPAFEALDTLEARIVATLGAGIGEPGGPLRPLDRRLRLAACPSPPQLAVPTPASAVVQCVSQGWRIYVPLVRTAGGPAAAAGPTEREIVVRRGDQVDVVRSGANFSVSIRALAQQDGAVGDRIRVRIEGRSAPITAEVAAEGRLILR